MKVDEDIDERTDDESTQIYDFKKMRGCNLQFSPKMFEIILYHVLRII